MIHLEILVEEQSAEVALSNLLPNFFSSNEFTFEIYSHQGKKDLLQKLPARLKGYRSWLPEEYRIVVLVDQDDDSCKELKKQLEEAAIRAGFKTKSSKKRPFQVLNRIAIEELEAWFLGDSKALRQAYPKVPHFEKKERYRNPDASLGGTWEVLEKLLQDSGYYKGGLPKIAVARNISKFMRPQNNNASPSFRVFIKGLKTLIDA